jgi:hypothetical protein
VVQQLKPRPKFLHTYLDALFRRDPHLGYEFHDLQIELYAEFEPVKLLDFLRASNYYSLEKVKDTDIVMCYINALWIIPQTDLVSCRPTRFVKSGS